MNKYDLVQQEIARGSSYQHEVLKLLCEIADILNNLVSRIDLEPPLVRNEPENSIINNDKWIEKMIEVREKRDKKKTRVGMPLEKDWKNKNILKEENHEEDKEGQKESC